jgi:hypothetical protein
MSFGIDNLPGAPYCPDYARLLKHYERIVPIRGRERNISHPYAGRRQPLYIRKEEDTNNIVIRFYTTDVATFCPDGTITVGTGGYGTKSTAYVLARILGTYVLHKGRGLWVDAHMEGTEFPENAISDMRGRHTPTYFPIPRLSTFRKIGGRLTFIPTPDCPSIFPTSHVVNRKEALAARKKFKAFKVFYKQMFELCEGKFTDEYGEAVQVQPNFWKSKDTATAKIAKLGATDPSHPDALDNYMKAARMMAPSVHSLKWNPPNVVLKGRLAYIDNIILLSHADLIYERVTVKTGKVPVDPLAKLHGAMRV